MACRAERSLFIPTNLDYVVIVGVCVLLWLITVRKLAVFACTMTCPSACALCHSYEWSYGMPGCTCLPAMRGLPRLEIGLCSVA